MTTDLYQSSRPYKYRLLESAATIRVLALHPAQGLKDLLKANLVHLENERPFLASKQPDFYEAVSYCWGNSILSHTIIIDEDSTLGITGSADVLLRHLRSRTKFRYLWIDAICLNQDDRHEKEVQVQLMDKIYAQSSKVHIWFGKATEEQKIPLLFNTLKWLASRLKIKEYISPAVAERVIGDSCGLDWRDTMNHFFDRPYFQRRWILQEVGFGDHAMIHCGRWKIPWQWFIQGVQGLQVAVAQGLSMDSKTEAVLNTILAIQDAKNHTMINLLWKFHQSQCSMPQDKIFALFALAEDAKRIPGVDYGKHWVQTFTDVAGMYFQDNQATMWFHLANFGSVCEVSPQDFPYPSWVPNWNNARSQNSVMPDTIDILQSYSSFKQKNFFYNPKLQTIEFDSHYVGHIENVSASWTRPFSASDQSAEILWSESQITSLSEALLTIFLTTTGRATERFKEARRADESTPVALKKGLLEIIRDVGPWSRKSAAHSNTPYHIAIASILDVLWNEYDIILTYGKRKAIGISPRRVRSGDILLLLPLPQMYLLRRNFGVIVRPVSEDPQRTGCAHIDPHPPQILSDCKYVGACSYAHYPISVQDLGVTQDEVHVQLV